MRILLIGFGTVGQALVRLLDERRARLLADHGINPRILAVVDSTGARVSPEGLDPQELLRVKKERGRVSDGNGLTADRVIEECEADVVVEAAPTVLSDPRPALERLKIAFRTGKHAVCVNKAPLAVALPALRELADYNRVQFRFSGTVGGGTPVLEWGRGCAEGDEVLDVRAILNGTTNYILTRMHEADAPFDHALREAQQRGYAEADPSADVDGLDAAVKLVIFANWVLDRRVSVKDARVRGIRGCESAVKEAKAAGKTLKLIARIGAELSVEPEPVAAGSPLDVRGSLNAVTMTLRAAGEVTLVGRGAGGAETATAALRDLTAIWHAAWDHRLSKRSSP